jgi:hypothetical protein
MISQAQLELFQLDMLTVAVGLSVVAFGQCCFPQHEASVDALRLIDAADAIVWPFTSFCGAFRWNAICRL